MYAVMSRTPSRTHREPSPVQAATNDLPSITHKPGTSRLSTAKSVLLAPSNIAAQPITAPEVPLLDDEKAAARLKAALARYGVTMKRPDICGETNSSRSTSYNWANPKHPNFDPDMPVGFKLSPSPIAPTLWWTIDVMAWLERRALRFRIR